MDAKDIAYGMISAVATYLFLYYLLASIKGDGNLWLGAFVLLVLFSVAVVTCPIVGFYKKGK